MGRTISGLLAGLVFGVGLTISGLVDPSKVVAFLDVAGSWDPSLAFVMLGGIAVAAVGFKLVLRRSQPIFESKFMLPTRKDIDRNLVVGAGLFGIGWGLAGYCPGPALAGLGLGSIEAVVFVAAMVVGMFVVRQSGGLISRVKSSVGTTP
tara:strand:+ start:1066 stop:1515 length:450 start_codon:yes stop_codon:yes gene_type:complete